MKDEFWNNSSSIILERVERCKIDNSVLIFFVLNLVQCILVC